MLQKLILILSLIFCLASCNKYEDFEEYNPPHYEYIQLITDIDNDVLTAFIECPPYNWTTIEYYWDNNLIDVFDYSKIIPIFKINIKDKKDKHILKAIIILNNQNKIELTQEFIFNVNTVNIKRHG